MSSDEKEILSKKFDDVKKEVKEESMSTCSTLFIGVLSSLLCNFVMYVIGVYTDKNNNFNLWKFNLGIIGVCLVVYILYNLHVKCKYHRKWNKVKDKKIALLEKENESLKKTHVYTLEESMNLKTNVENFMKEFVEHTQYVDAIQIHDYDIYSEEKSAVISIKFEKQYLRESKKHYLNAITNYYKIDIDIFKRFYQILDNYKEKLNPEDETKLLSDINNLMIDVLKNKTEENIRIYSVLCIISTKINEYIGEEIEKVNDTSLQETAYTLTQDNTYNNDKKRTGILGSVLLDDIPSISGYAYSYNKNNEFKIDRKYYSFCDSIYEEEYIFTIIVDTSLAFGDKFDSLMLDILKSYYETKERFKI